MKRKVPQDTEHDILTEVSSRASGILNILSDVEYEASWKQDKLENIRIDAKDILDNLKELRR